MQNSSIDTGSRVIIRTTAALKAGIPYILHQGGTSSGKTFGILYSLLFYALEFLRPNSIVTIMSMTLPHLKKGAILDFKKILGLTVMSDHVIENKSDHSFKLPNGTIFEFYAPDDEGKARSGKRDLLFINEANGTLYEVAKQLIMRTNGPVILDWNPSGKFWFHRKYQPYLKDFEYLFTKTTYRDNKSVSQKIIDEIERLRLIDPSQYDVYGLGEEGKGIEIIYPNYTLVDEFPDTDYVSVGLDFGFTNSSSASARCALYDGGLYFDEIFYEKGMSNKAIYEAIESQSFSIPKIIADQNEPKSIKELQDMGLNIFPCTKGADSVKFGIDKIKEYKIYLTKSSENLIDEMDGYKWVMKDGIPTNVPVKKNDHLMDAIRYGIQGILNESTPVRAGVQNAKSMGFTNIGI